MTVASLLEDLGYETKAGDLDETLRWALIELKLRRKRFAMYEFLLDIMDSWPEEVFEIQRDPYTITHKVD